MGAVEANYLTSFRKRVRKHSILNGFLRDPLKDDVLKGSLEGVTET